MANNTLYDFEDINAVLRQIPLNELAQTVAAEAGGPENYTTLRGQGMNDLDIVGQYVTYPKIAFDLPAMYDVYDNDPQLVAREIANYAGIDYDDLRSQGGLKPENVIKFFAEGRELTTGEAVREGVGRGLTVGVPAAASATAGAVAGVPLGPPGMIGGAILSGIIGGTGGSYLEQEIFPSSPILNPNARATMEGVKTATEAATFLTQPWALARMGRYALSTDPGGGYFVQSIRNARDTDIIKNFVKKNGRPPTANEIMTQRGTYEGSPLGRFLLAAERNPKLFYAIEGLGVGGAGIGAGIAEYRSPEDMGTRLASEVIGSFTGQAFMLIPSIADVVGDKLVRFSKSATERRAAEGLVNLLELYNENPEEIIKQLQSGQGEIAKLYSEFQAAYQPDPNVLARLAGVEIEEASPGLFAPTVGDVTDSFVLRLLEKSIFDSGPTSGPLVKQRARNNVENLQRLLTMATLSGDADAVREAAALRQAVFEDLIAARLQTAGASAENAVNKINVKDPEAGAKAGRIISSLIENAYGDIRAQENALYNAVNGNFIVPTANTQRAIQDLIDQVPDVLQNKKDYFPQEALEVLDDLIGSETQQRKTFIADLMSGDVETTGALAKTIGADPQTLNLVSLSDIPSSVLEKLPGNVRQRLTRLDETLNERNGLMQLVENLQPPEGVSGKALSETAREYRAHFDDLAEQFPEQFTSGLQALQQYERAQTRLRGIPKDILDNAVTAADILPTAQSIPDPEPITAEKLNKLRGAFLDMANVAMSGEKSNRILARQYGLMQRAILEDFGDVNGIRKANLRPSEMSSGMLSGAQVIPELAKLEKARAFSVAKNDAFQRAFPNQILRDKTTGAAFIEPELLRQKILAGGGDATKLRMDQLRNAVAMMSEQGLIEISPEEAQRIAEDITSLRDAEDMMLRLISRDKINQETQEVNVDKLQADIQKYESALNLFPDLKADLQDTVRTQYRLQALEESAAEGSLAQVKSLVNKYSTNLIGDNLVGAFVDAIDGPQPSKALPNLIRHLQQAIPKYETRIGGDSTFLPGGVRAVRRGDFDVEDVNKALRATIFDTARVYAGGTSEAGINFDQYKKFLFGPGKGQSEPIMRTLIKTGVMTQEEASRLNSLLTKSAAIQNKLVDKNQAEVVKELSGAEDLLTDLVLRLTGAEIGATAGRAIPGRGSGQGLIQAQAGSQFARKLLGGIPLGNLREILDSAARDPQLMAQLLQKGLDRKTDREKRLFATGFGAALRASGLTTAAEAVEESLRSTSAGQIPPEGTERFPIPQPQNLQTSQINAPRMQPATPPMPAPPMPQMPMPPAPPAMAQGPQQQMERQRYAQAYPFDPISDIIRTQGIGGLV